MKIVEYTTEQLRRIVCALRRKLAQAQSVKPNLTHDASSYAINHFSINGVGGPVPYRIVPARPQRISIFFYCSPGTTGNILIGPNSNLALGGATNDIFLSLVAGQQYSLYAYQSPAIVTSEWYVDDNGNISRFLSVFEEYYLG